MAKYHDSLLDYLEEEDELLKLQGDVNRAIIHNLHEAEDISLHTIEEREAFEKEANRLKEVEKDISKKLELNKKGLKRHILKLFED